MDRKQFTFYESWYTSISRIRKAADRAKAYDTIIAYALRGIEPVLEELPDIVAIIFENAKPNIDASRKKAESGKKGGEGKRSESKAEANAKQTASENEIEKEKEYEIEKEIENECYNAQGAETGTENILSFYSEKIDSFLPEKQQAELVEMTNRLGYDKACEVIRQTKADGWPYWFKIKEDLLAACAARGV